MRKLFFFLSLCFIVIACSNQNRGKYMATNVKTLTIEDSNGKPIKLNVEYWFGMPNDTAAPINSMIIDEDDYKEFVHQLFFDTGGFGAYLDNEYSYTPIRIYDWAITDSLMYNNEIIYMLRYYVEYRENNQKLSGSREMYAWHEVYDNTDANGVTHDKIRKWWLMRNWHYINKSELWNLYEIIQKFSHRR